MSIQSMNKIMMACCLGMVFLGACEIHAQEETAANKTEFQITQLTDFQYPDNPDIGFTAS